jgi:hypothetical protein
VLLSVALFSTAHAAGAPLRDAVGGSRRPFRLRVVVSPSTVKLGERATYRAFVTEGTPGYVRVLPPESGGDLDWGAPRVRGRAPRGEPQRPDARGWYRTFGSMESLAVTVPLQVFRPGLVSVPGLRFQLNDGRGPTEHRLPTARLYVVPVVPPEDSSADLRPLRGPFGAPWWERVPWRLVGVAAGVLGVAALVVWRLTRRRPGAAPVLAHLPRDPALDALQALEALRGLRLPEHGRFAEHAFHLTRILRRFLEATEGTPRPGDSTPELVRHLEAGRLGPADLERLGALLAAWDRVKFARAATTLEEARRAEDAVEELARRRVPVPGKEAA